MESWAVQAIIGGFLLGLYFRLNQNIRLNGIIFMTFRGFILVAATLPFIPFFTPVPHWQFYVFCILNGAGIAFIDYFSFKAIRFWGAEVVTAMQPLNVGITFVLWLAIKPRLIVFYIQQPIKFGLIVLCLAGVSFALIKYNQIKVSRKALKYMIPVLIAGSVNEVVNKWTLGYGSDNLQSAVFYYILLTALTIGIINLVRYWHKGESLKNLVLWKNLKNSWIFIILIAAMVFRNTALFMTVNPAYVSAIVNLYVLWIMLGNNLLVWLGKGIRYQQMNKKAVLMLLACAVGLILLTGN